MLISAGVDGLTPFAGRRHMTSSQGSERPLAKLVFVISVCAGYAVVFAGVVYVVLHTGGS